MIDRLNQYYDYYNDVVYQFWDYKDKFDKIKNKTEEQLKKHEDEMKEHARKIKLGEHLMLQFYEEFNPLMEEITPLLKVFDLVNDQRTNMKTQKDIQVRHGVKAAVHFTAAVASFAIGNIFA